MGEMEWVLLRMPWARLYMWVKGWAGRVFEEVIRHSA